VVFPDDADTLPGVPDLLTDRGVIDVPDRVLVVCAHPDDVDFGSAGTVAALTDAGADVAYCMVTSGEAGSDHLTIDATELAALREEEQTAAAKEVGVTELHWLHHPDGQVEATLELRHDSAVIREVQPGLVITQSPERNLSRVFASHPDHMAAGEAALCAVYPDARNPRAFPDLRARGLEAHVVERVWLTSHSEADLRVDVTATFDRKIAALRAHRSQTGHRNDLDDMIRGWLTAQAAAGDMAEGHLAEGYKEIVTGG
jgi:LmbE family N-acetylglucosaminyl deacetylase